jgi:hypothetical protein
MWAKNAQHTDKLVSPDSLMIVALNHMALKYHDLKEWYYKAARANE